MKTDCATRLMPGTFSKQLPVAITDLITGLGMFGKGKAFGITLTGAKPVLSSFRVIKSAVKAISSGLSFAIHRKIGIEKIKWR